jgi:hypothetical protein
VVIFSPSLLGTFRKSAKIQKFMDEAEYRGVIKIKTDSSLTNLTTVNISENRVKISVKSISSVPSKSNLVLKNSTLQNYEAT